MGLEWSPVMPRGGNGGQLPTTVEWTQQNTRFVPFLLSFLCPFPVVFVSISCSFFSILAMLLFIAQSRVPLLLQYCAVPWQIMIKGRSQVFRQIIPLL